ncbi:hypothetical protein WAI453_007955 [Rhynchosporium graminicola]
MPPPLTMALMQSRPLLNPSPKTIVAALLISNPIYHKCRISDYLHLVFQWGIHTSVYLKKEICSFENVYTSAATIRQLRKHEGHPARAPDGTIMEIAGEACPGDSGESVGPWDLENVHLCEGFGDWSAALSRTLQMAFAAGLNFDMVNEPKPSLNELDKANMVDAEWLNGKPLHPTTKKNLTLHRDGIRDKVDAFLAFVDIQVKSQSRKELIFTTLGDALESALVGNAVSEFNGIFGGMVNKIVIRTEDFMRYLEEKIDSQEARQQRVDEVREFIDTALKGNEKRKREDREEENHHERKKVMTEDVRKAIEKHLTKELTLGAQLSKDEQEARLTRARKREERKQKEWEAEAEFDTHKDRRREKRESREKISSEAAPAFQSGVTQSRVEELKYAAQTIRATAKAKEIEAYADKGTSPKSPAYRRRPSLRRPASPPPPYTGSLFSTHSNAVSPAFLTPQTGSASSTPQQMPNTSVISRLTTPGPPEQLKKQKPMSSAQRIMDQINNPGKRYKDSSVGGNSPRKRSESAAPFIVSTRPQRQPLSRLLSTFAASQTDKEVSPAYEEEEPRRVLSNELPDAAPKAAMPSPFSQSLPQPSVSLSNKDHDIMNSSSAVMAEPEAKNEAPQEDESSLFLPLAQPTLAAAHSPPQAAFCATALAPPLTPPPPPPLGPAPAASIGHGNGPGPALARARAPSSAPPSIPERRPLPEQKAGAIRRPRSEPTSQPRSSTPQTQREPTPDTDSDSDLPPPPTKSHPTTPKPPIYIDLSDPLSYSSPQPSFNDPLSPTVIKTEPSSSNCNYVIIKDENSDPASMRDIKPIMYARANVKGRIKTKVKKEEEDGDDDDVLMCDGEEWTKEVREKNRKALERVRGW